MDSGDLHSVPATPSAGKHEAHHYPGHHHCHHPSHNGNQEKSPEAPAKLAPVVQKYLPDLLEPLAWLAGKWIVHEPGRCFYPTMKTQLIYGETVEFVFTGQKMLDFKTVSWAIEKGPDSPLHREFGFLRIKPGTHEAALVLAHNFGVSETLEGTFTEDTLTLRTSGISRMSFAADPAVTYTERIFKYDPETEELEHVMRMATTHTDLTEHLRIRYKRAQHSIS